METYEETCRCQALGYHEYNEVCGLCEAKEEMLETIFWHCMQIAKGTDDLSLYSLERQCDGWTLYEMSTFSCPLSTITGCLGVTCNV